MPSNPTLMDMAHLTSVSYKFCERTKQQRVVEGHISSDQAVMGGSEICWFIGGDGTFMPEKKLCAALSSHDLGLLWESERISPFTFSQTNIAGTNREQISTEEWREREIERQRGEGIPLSLWTESGRRHWLVHQCLSATGSLSTLFPLNSREKWTDARLDWDWLGGGERKGLRQSSRGR